MVSFTDFRKSKRLSTNLPLCFQMSTVNIFYMAKYLISAPVVYKLSKILPLNQALRFNLIIHLFNQAPER